MYSCLTNIPTEKNSKSAFTLIEMLVVVAIVLVLTGITFGISKGVLNQQARAQAKAELAMIAQALEAFKLKYGDYPVVSEDNPVTENANSKALTSALTGYSYMEPGEVQGTRVMTNVNDGEVRESFLDVEKLNFSEPFRDPSNSSRVPDSAGDLNRIYLVDPWRQPYVYVYNKGSSTNDWDAAGYVLFSKGPDRKADLDNGTTAGNFEDDGVIDQTNLSHEDNIDNIYPNQQ